MESTQWPSSKLLSLTSMKSQGQNLYSITPESVLNRQFQEVKRGIIEQIGLEKIQHENQIENNNEIRGNEDEQDQNNGVGQQKDGDQQAIKRNAILHRESLNSCSNISNHGSNSNGSGSFKAQSSPQPKQKISLLQNSHYIIKSSILSNKLQSSQSPQPQPTPKIQRQPSQSPPIIFQTSFQNTYNSNNISMNSPTLGDISFMNRESSRSVSDLFRKNKNDELNVRAKSKTVNRPGNIDNQQIQESNEQAESSSNSQKQRKFRIQKPDEVFEQLEKQKDQASFKRATQIVNQNINNTKNMLNNQSLQNHAMSIEPSFSLNSILDDKNMNIGKVTFPKTKSIHNTIIYIQSIKSPKKSHQNLLHQSHVSMLQNMLQKISTNPNKLQNIISTCLFKHEYNANGSSYFKYKYEINEGYFIINNEYWISFKNIKKIKLIHSQYNRPEIKILYIHDSSNKKIKNHDKNKRTSDQSSQAKKKQAKQGRSSIEFEKSYSFGFIEQMFGNEKNMKEKQLEIYLCECYENIYTLYASIIVRKLLQKSKESKIDRLKDRMGSFAVTSHLLNPHFVNNEDISAGWDYKVQGYIMKKSKHLKNWQKRYVRISNFALKSYRIKLLPASSSSKTNLRQSSSGAADKILEAIAQSTHQQVSNQCTYELDNLRQLWTRFQTQDNEYLVMKMYRKNKLQKIEIAIPIVNYADITLPNNWLFGLVTLLKGQS